MVHGNIRTTVHCKRNRSDIFMNYYLYDRNYLEILKPIFHMLILKN